MTTLTPIAGVTRLRAFQLGLETTPLTQHAATRRMPWSFVPTVDPHWTWPTADTGTLDPAIPPYRTASDITGQSTGECYANDMPNLLSGAVMGGITPTTSSTAKIWTYSPASTSQDVFDTQTGEWFDDATGDAMAYPGGVLESVSFTYPQDLGPITHTGDWRFSDVVYPATPTGALAVDAAPVQLYAADTTLSVNDTAGAIGTTVFQNQVYDIAITLTNNLDIKRFQNGSNTRFDVASYGRGARSFQLVVTFAKATAAIAEVVKWLGASPTERFFEVNTSSVSAAAVGIPYSLVWRVPGFWFTRSEQTINSNTAFQLTAQGFYDQTLLYPFHVVSTGTRASL